MLRKDYVYTLLKKRIVSGEYPSGSKLPGENILARQLNVSRVTLRAALSRLQEEFLIEKNGRSGNYVTGTTRKRFIFLTFYPNLDELSLVLSYFVSELQNALNKLNHSLILYSALRLFETDAESFGKSLKDNDISGIFLHTVDFTKYPALLDLVRNCHIPIVEFGNNLSTDGAFASVCTDMRQAFSDGVRFLATHGYKRIATIFKRDSMRGFTRSTYEEFLTSIGLTESIPLIYDTSIINENKLPELLTSPDRPEAFMCFCDAIAAKVINVVQKCKLNVPDDVAVMGISGYLERLFISPPLSVINFHYDRMAQEAVRLMLEQYKWFFKEPAVISYISHEIVQRGTTPKIIKNIFNNKQRS